MRVAIAGAGKVGRAIARELILNGHDILLIDRDPEKARPGVVEGAGVLLGDTCEIAVLDQAELPTCQVMIAATGDDKVNLVVSLLAKTEYGVPRVVARVNHPKNEWMFDEAWGVDVAVSTPRLMTALVEEAVTVGDLVRIFEFRKGRATMVEMTLPSDSPHVGERVGDVPFPQDTVLVAIIRDQIPIAPSTDDSLEAHDELLLLTTPDSEEELEQMLSPTARVKRPREM